MSIKSVFILFHGIEHEGEDIVNIWATLEAAEKALLIEAARIGYTKRPQQLEFVSDRGGDWLEVKEMEVKE